MAFVGYARRSAVMNGPGCFISAERRSLAGRGFGASYVARRAEDKNGRHLDSKTRTTLYKRMQSVPYLVCGWLFD